MKGLLALGLAGLFLAWAIYGPNLGGTDALEEASGIARLGSDLLIVDDGVAGSYFRHPVDGFDGGLLEIGPGRLDRITIANAGLAIDLESIDVLADGRIVVLSERLRSLVSKDGLVAEYDDPFGEFGNVGLEGLAVRAMGGGDSRIAVLWEGGYPNDRDLMSQIRSAVDGVPLRPVIVVHDLEARTLGLEVRSKNVSDIVKLDLPKIKGKKYKGHRFKAPDLVWHEPKGKGSGKWGFIVLLSSESDAERDQLRHRWLQRYDAKGRMVGDPLDLDSFVPKELKGANWEGLGWFEENESLVLIYDSKPRNPPSALVVELPKNWR